jgi:DNA replication protein DnaC
MEAARNGAFAGGPGSGKSHLATAIGMNAIRQGKSVRFWSVVDLVNQLETGKRSPPTGRTASIAEKLAHRDAVVLDELGYLPFSPGGAALLFHLISKLYERTSLIVTTKSRIQRMGNHLRRRQDDHGAPLPPDPPLRHRRDRQRELPLQAPQLKTINPWSELAAERRSKFRAD